jgi:predicted Zn-dependent protease
MRRSPRLLIAVFIALMGLITYYSQREVNPVTGEVQHIALSTDQEIALGLNSAPQMAAELGGVDPDPQLQAYVQSLGKTLVSNSDAQETPYQFQFYVLRDQKTVNAFALPGGPIFITRALLSRLQDEAQLAGVLGHEVGHVVARHAAEHIAKSQLAQTLVGATAVAASDEYGRGQQAAMMAAFVAQMMQLRYGRDDELESDKLGVRFMSDAGYDPGSLIEVMEILARAAGPGRQPEFMSTHPDPGNRKQMIQQAIAEKFPEGVPPNLTRGRALASR